MNARVLWKTLTASCRRKSGWRWSNTPLIKLEHMSIRLTSWSTVHVLHGGMHPSAVIASIGSSSSFWMQEMYPRIKECLKLVLIICPRPWVVPRFFFNIIHSAEFPVRCSNTHFKYFQMISGSSDAYITVFKPATPGSSDGPRIWNDQLLQYAAYRSPPIPFVNEGEIIGDPKNVSWSPLLV